MIRLSKSLFTVASQAWEYERVSKSLSYSSDAQTNTAELLTECYLCASRSPVVVLTAVLTAFSAIFAVHRRLFRPQCHGKRRSKTLPTKKNQAKRNSIVSSFLDCAALPEPDPLSTLCGAIVDSSVCRGKFFCPVKRRVARRWTAQWC